MLTDSHCHLASRQYTAEEFPELINRAHAASVTRMITLATCLDDLEANLTLARHPSVHACIGIHPCDVHHAPDDALAELAKHVTDPRVCGIGETGLDYFHPAPDDWDLEKFRARQRDFLHQHFQLAAQAGLNVVIHTRDREGDASFVDALEIYRVYHQSVRAVFHCFIGPWENAKQVIDLGGLVSFGGVATFKTAQQVRDTLQQCPAGSFMIETDAPYLSPEPFRGKRNEPSRMFHTAERLAELRGQTLQQVAEETERCVESFFRLHSDSI
jgi:TatD DNase family protein